jgi:drug/metabolite transporter (DMT)-like permease
MSAQRQRDIEKAVAKRRQIDSSASRSRESGAAARALLPSETFSAPERASSPTMGSSEAVPAAPARTRLILVLAALATLYLVWGSTYLAIRIGIGTMPPLLMASVRFAIAGVVLYAWSVRRGDTSGDRPGRRQWIATAIVGVLLLAGGNGGVSWGEQFVPSGVAALLVASVPIWMVILAHFTGDDRISWPVGAGLAIGIAGVALLVQPAGAGSNHLLGSIVILGAALAWAAGSVYARRAPLPARPLVSTGMEMIAGSVALLFLGVATGEVGRVHLEQISWQSLAALAYLVVFGSLLAFSAYVWLLRHTRTAVAGTYAFVNPAVAVLLGATFVGEVITPRVLVGGSVIILAVVLVFSAPALRQPMRWLPLTSRRRRIQESCPETA